MRSTDDRGRLLLMAGIFLTLSWTTAVLVYVGTRIGWSQLPGLSAAGHGGLLAGYAGPLAFLWLFLVFLKRNQEVADHTAALKAELQRLRDPLGDAEAKAARIADALRERAELVETATAAADAQLAKAAALLESQSQALAGAAAKVVQELTQARDSLSDQRGRLEEDSTRAARLLREQVGELELHITETGQRLERQTAAFAASAEAARRALAEPVDALAAFGDTLAA